MPSPQRVRWAKFRSSMVAVAALVILAVLVYLLSGGTWLKPKTYLLTYLPDSSGLAAGADVQLNGVQIGTVEWLRLTRSTAPDRVVEARLTIEKEYLRHIPDDSVTEIDSANLLGDEYIDILMGRSANPVQEGAELPYRQPTSIMQNIDLLQFQAQLRTIDRTIIDIQAGKGPLGQFVVSDTLYQRFLDGVDRVEKSMRKATSSQSQFGQVLYSTDLYDSVSATLRQLDNRLAQLQSSPLLRDPARYEQIRGQIANVRRTLADLNAGKGAGRLLSSDAVYTGLTRRLADWIAAVDTLNSGEGSTGQMLSSAQVYTSLVGALRDLQATLKDFREHPQKYLRIKF